MTAAKSAWPALLFLVSTVVALPSSGSFGVGRLHKTSATSSARKSTPQLHRVRGGAISSDGDTDSSDYDESDSEYDDEEEEEDVIVVKAKQLAASAKDAALKKKRAAIKSKVKVAMAASSKAKAASAAAKKTSGGGLYRRYVPYIVRASLNPFTLFAMTKAYFLSLCNINYLKEDDSQTLRSAVQEKARKQPPSSPTKPNRKMRPGQAKTLSDLPQLSA